MKKLVVVLLAMLAISLQTLAYNRVRLVINSGINDPIIKSRIEQALSTIMSEINRAQAGNVDKLVFPTNYIAQDAIAELNKLWRNEHFRCVEEEIVERGLTTRYGYQVRGIPLIVNSASDNEELGYQEAVINFDKRGIITSFYYTIDPELYSKLRMDQMKDKRFEVTDLKDRMMILDYVEHFRTAYNQKDLKFLNQVFSDDALIITGKVIKVQKSEMFPLGNKVVYSTQTKHQYLENLRRAFQSAKYIKVLFDDVTIVQHPIINGVYGVTVHQKWNTNRYSDVGYVFMMWDFRNPEAPQIHVRTWQPEFIDQISGKKLNPNDVFSLGDFDIK